MSFGLQTALNFLSSTIKLLSSILIGVFFFSVRVCTMDSFISVEHLNN